MVNQSGVESRRTPRRVYQRPIGILCQGAYFLAQAHQLSEGGLLFSSDRIFTAGDLIVISLVMPDGGSVVVRAEVIYERPGKRGSPPQYGVRFQSLHIPQRRQIRNYVAAKTQKEAEAELEDEVPPSSKSPASSTRIGSRLGSR